MKQIKALRGFRDVEPSQSHIWQKIEKIMRDTAADFGYREVRTPVLEHTELFTRGVGESSDIVQKEMYTFVTKGNDSVTMKPEGTAGAVRQYLEHKGYNDTQPYKMYYVYCPAYRYERPQAGRFREHHQFGIECFGSPDPIVDAEIISLATQLLCNLGIDSLAVHVNNIGCNDCRPAYNKKLVEYFESNINEMCDDCKNRLEINPLRILDCKQTQCRPFIEKAPVIIDNVCQPCKDHFDSAMSYLSDVGIDYEIDNRLVRGLDYYTRTVFEIVSERIGAQGSVCGGGRYDGLIEELGGPRIPGAGFGMGMERLILQMEQQEIDFGEVSLADVYIANVGEEAKKLAWKISSELRNNSISSSMDAMNRSVKAQFKYADKINAKFVIVIGDDEIANGSVNIRNMTDGSEVQCAIDKLAKTLQEII